MEQQITVSVTANPRILTGFTSAIPGKQALELHASCTMRLENYIVDTESAIGMVMTGDVYAGEQIIRDRLVRIGETDTQRNTLAYAITPGMRAVTIFVDQDTGLANFLKPGNWVNVLASYTREEDRSGVNARIVRSAK